MESSFNDNFDQYSVWRQNFSRLLNRLNQWMGECDFIDASTKNKLQRLEEQILSDRVMLAFVAEFSRGKSELINAIFFANYGRRIMPASAGRTTMCPTELGYEHQLPPSVRLLSIDTRLSSLSLQEWRRQDKHWLAIPIDVNDADQVAAAVQRVTETKRVSIQEAQGLGFWHEDMPNDNPSVDVDGLVEVPLWRHAIINMPHPLLQQGLVILDTPGLNAVGVEPELTINLIPQAHAVIFILGADTGVTKSDLSIWRDHLATHEDGVDTRLVVLNKIDTLWDGLTSPEKIQAQLLKQCHNSAEMLDFPLDKVIPVSAQKGLVAKIKNDQHLLALSGLPDLENILNENMVQRRRKMLHSVVSVGVNNLKHDIAKIFQIKRRDLEDQAAELRSLRGKNATVIQSMRSRIESEQRDFDAGGTKIHALKAVHAKSVKDIYDVLSVHSLKRDLYHLSTALQQKGLKLGVKTIYSETFLKIREHLHQVQSGGVELQQMLDATFRQLNADFGFSLQVAPPPTIDSYLRDLAAIEQSHIQYLGVGHFFKLAQKDFSDRLVRALGMRLRAIYESVANELEIWSRAATAQLDSQLRDRHTSFGRRIDAVDRIQSAAGGLIERLTEIEGVERQLLEQEKRLHEIMVQLQVFSHQSATKIVE